MCKIYLSEDGCEKVNDKEAAEFKDVAIMRQRELTRAAQEDWARRTGLSGSCNLFSTRRRQWSVDTKVQHGSKEF